MDSYLKEDYIQLCVALEIDDIDTSLSTLFARNNRLGEIVDIIPPEDLGMWDKEVDNILENTTHFSGGSPYQ